MAIKVNNSFENGYNKIVSRSEFPEYLMDYGMLKLKKEEKYISKNNLERAFLLISGEIELKYEGKIENIKRPNFYDYDPYMLHLPKEVELEIKSFADSEIAIFETENNKVFNSKLYTPNDIIIETRGKGSMNETGTRIVRTILDYSINNKSNLMIGEDMHYPGKWAGFPSHHHEQPEIYYYKFNREDGFGLLKLGEEGVLINDNDTILIPPGKVHPQVSAPGYAMYFIWTIRHLDNNPYIKPTFVEKHLWVEDGPIWPDEK